MSTAIILTTTTSTRQSVLVNHLRANGEQSLHGIICVHLLTPCRRPRRSTASVLHPRMESGKYPTNKLWPGSVLYVNKSQMA